MNDFNVDNNISSLSSQCESDNERISQIAKHYEAIISLLGEDPEREGLLKTPMRAAKALWYTTSGYRQNADVIMQQAVFEHAGSKMIIVKDIEFFSTCEHHILPFFGRVSIGYLPGKKIIGLSKLARVVDVYARRLQVQERMTAQIADAIMRNLDTAGVIVTVTAQHLCMKMRGVEKQDSSTTTTEYRGAFTDDPSLRKEFYELVNAR